MTAYHHGFNSGRRFHIAVNAPFLAAIAPHLLLQFVGLANDPMHPMDEECCVGRLSPKPSTVRQADIPQGCDDRHVVVALLVLRRIFLP